ncbi:MAG: translation initiation factor IF-2 [Alphaproteobacteria bacterium]|nr:translation initiation factor IF-2 [Alphaproteobacteria bacterium]NCQ67293.1 translation initiation factor IF-2 [Alphaproteobacteria bacterium]NCT06740.1 translation initiation factor IF-2 [Alphaproteobacteria bacterium]
MADQDNKTDQKKTLSLSSKKLELTKTVDAGKIRQSFSHGRSKAVTFEVKKKRVIGKDSGAASGAALSEAELAKRKRILEMAQAGDEKKAEEQRILNEVDEKRLQDLTERQKQSEQDEAETLAAKELAEKEAVEAKRLEEEKRAEQEAARKTSQSRASVPAEAPHAISPSLDVGPLAGGRVKSSLKKEEEDSESDKKSRKTLSLGKKNKHKPVVYSVQDALAAGEDDGRHRSDAARRRAKEKKLAQQSGAQDGKAQVRDIVVPEVITVQELSNRMAVRAGEIIKKLMGFGVMATLNQNIDADTAELIVTEFGHKIIRVSDADVEEGLLPHDDPKELQEPRAPVVTVMGHVDHGKTSLLDAIRKTDVVTGESGGITQHIGAYQVQLASGKRITFIDTPGHAAFSEMRARGANVTDIVVLVVAADDGIKEQTVEAINHAKAAGVPIIIAINKMDKPGADPNRVRSELLTYELVTEEMGGDIQTVEVSAKQGLNIDKLEEAVLLQAEILELGSNPNRDAIGSVVESRIEKGRGAVATVLVQQGTLRIGDIFVAGSEWGKVRALIDDKGKQIKKALPSMPVEVLGFSGAPIPGDSFIVVEDESRARDVAAYRAQKEKDRKAVKMRKASMDLLMQGSSDTEKKTLSVIIKSDVQGSVEAIMGSFDKIPSDEVEIRVLHTGVGGINESDITLAQTTNAFVIGFNVRSNPQARQLATKENIEIRYYSIIYDVIDDIKKIVSGLLTPEKRENFLGYAEVREVFNITKIGKVAGCYVTGGLVKRGAKVRLLRDNVVIHEGSLKTLKRFKDEVKEAKEGYECGMAFENYNDIRPKDVIECFEVQEIARTIE